MITSRKVTYIPPRSVRFADCRTDRNLFARFPAFKKQLRDATKRLAPLYKALRLDKRFAAPHLALALKPLLLSVPVDMLLRAPLRRHQAALNWEDSWKSLNIDAANAEIGMYTAAHVALTDPSKVACYPTRTDATKRREVVLSPGKFYGYVHPAADPKDVQRFAEKHAAGFAPAQVHFIHNNDYAPDRQAELGDEWVRVYSAPRGFSSCMAGFDDNDYHPIRFYALPGNGLSLAYLTHDGTPDGDIVARAICHMGRKAVVRVYGDARLADLLASKYELILAPCTALDNVNCAALEDDDNLVAPYIDGNMQINWNGCSDVCTIVQYGNYTADGTEGYAIQDNSESCDCCGGSYPPEDLHYSEHHDSRICSECLDESYVRAVVSETTETDIVARDDTVRIDGMYYLNECGLIHRCGFVWSDHHDRYLAEERCSYVTYLGDYILDSSLVVLAVKTEDGDEWALEEDTKLIWLEGEQVRVHVDYDGPVDEHEPTLECAA